MNPKQIEAVDTIGKDMELLIELFEKQGWSISYGILLLGCATGYATSMATKSFINDPPPMP